MTNRSRHMGIPAFETLLQDVRYTGRMWRKNPTFTLFAVCGLALAIGANTAVFTVVNAALFRNLPFQGSERIAYVSSFDTAHGDEPLQSFSYPDYRDFKTRLKSFDDLAAVQYTAVNLSDDANFPERNRAVRMTANTLSVIGQRLWFSQILSGADELQSLVSERSGTDNFSPSHGSRANLEAFGLSSADCSRCQEWFQSYHAARRSYR